MKCMPCAPEAEPPAARLHERARQATVGNVGRAHTYAFLFHALMSFAWIGPAGSLELGGVVVPPTYSWLATILPQAWCSFYTLALYAISSYLLARVIEAVASRYFKRRTHVNVPFDEVDDEDSETEVEAIIESDSDSSERELPADAHVARSAATQPPAASAQPSPVNAEHHVDTDYFTDTSEDDEVTPHIVLEDNDGSIPTARPHASAGSTSDDSTSDVRAPPALRQRLRRSPPRRRLEVPPWDVMLRDGRAPFSSTFMRRNFGIDTNEPFTRAFHANANAFRLNEHHRRGRYQVGYALAISMLKFICLFTFLGSCESVTCTTCYDQIPGCEGGDTCLLHNTPMANVAIVAGGAGIITLRNLLPLKFLRECTRSVLDCLKMVANRPAIGTPIDLSAPAMTVDQLIEAVQTGRATPGEAVRETMTRVGGAGTQIELARLNALTNLLTNMEKSSGGAGAPGVTSRGGSALGSYSLVWALAGKITRQSLSVGIAGISEGTSAEVSSPAAQIVKLNIIRPTGMTEFSDMITIWLMICHATGLGNVLVLGEFLRDVVYDTMLKHGHSWQVAHELFLVYLEAVETSSDDAVNIRTVFVNGSQDTYLKRATDSASVEFKGVPLKPGVNKSLPTVSDGEIKWNGNYNRKATTPCFSFNMGTPHPSRSLDEKGTCKHNHVCDHWVSDKGPRGTCGGKHPRSRCDNPNKCDKQVTK